MSIPLNASLVPGKGLASRAEPLDCGPSQTSTLEALLFDIANWAGLCFNVLRDAGPTPEQMAINYHTFGFTGHIQRSLAKTEVRRRFESLRWEAERSPNGRIRGTGFVRLKCSTCARELRRSGYDLFAINTEPRATRRQTIPIYSFRKK
ncbi:MAG: hypothetical protein Q9160_005851 [Pyrenula sp. 1 TL-2023]